MIDEFQSLIGNVQRSINEELLRGNIVSIPHRQCTTRMKRTTGTSLISFNPS